MSQKIRIKLISYDHDLIDRSSERIVKTVEPTGAIVHGPIPLPTKREVFVINRSPHVNKKSREKFEQITHRRLVDIYPTNPKTISELSNMPLPPGVDAVIKTYFPKK